MPKQSVNLDALIPRADFEAAEESRASATLTQTMRLTDLERTSIVFQALRKPDFQRETADWSAETVAQLITSFLDGDLIPSLILWRSQAKDVFVIDGAHRLSALIAWIHDDYGDGLISREFYENLIPKEQHEAAEKTRRLVAKAVGSYEQVRRAGQHPTHSDPARVTHARNMSQFQVALQWVEGDASKAEDSFFRINQRAAPIDDVELRMIKARRKPNALAARALIRAGTGHKYWSRFDEEVQDEIEQIAGETYQALFEPPLETPIKTLDLPVAGRGYSARSVRLLFDFVNLANELQTEGAQQALSDDEDGRETITHLKNVRRIATRITGNQPRSLGLHPVVYFYGHTGRYQPTAFLATVTFIKELEKRDEFIKFTDHRREFEEFLLAHRYLINDMVRRHGSSLKGYGHVFQYYRLVMGGIEKGYNHSRIVEEIRGTRGYGYLRIIPGEYAAAGSDFSRDTKSAAFIRDAIETSPRCAICGARYHTKSITIDHIVRKSDGGAGSLTNAQVTHPFCNSGYKEQSAHFARRGP